MVVLMEGENNYSKQENNYDKVYRITIRNYYEK